MSEQPFTYPPQPHIGEESKSGNGLVTTKEFWKVIRALEEKFEDGIERLLSRINDTREGSSDRISRITTRLITIVVVGLGVIGGVMAYVANLYSDNAALRVDYTQKMLDLQIEHNSELIDIEREARQKNDDLLRDEIDRRAEGDSKTYW